MRTVPRSRRNPQFNQDSLPASLREAGIDYEHAAGLGGLRRPDPDSRNSAWENDSFRGYADYMGTEQFRSEIERLIEIATKQRVALMCAEAVPWRCHRSLIADVLVVRGLTVEHIMSRKQRRPHTLRSFAKISGIDVTYPANTPESTRPDS